MAKGRPKPLHGAKKWDRMPLPCTCKDCEEDFYISRCTTPATRKCAEHFAPVKTTKQKLNVELLDSIRKRGILIK